MSEKMKTIVNYVCMLPAVLLICTVFVIDNSIPQGIVMGQSFWFIDALALLSIAVFISCLINKKRFRGSFTDLTFFFFIISGASITWIIAGELTPRTVLLFSFLLLYFLFKTLMHQHKNTFYVLIICLMITGLVEAIWGLKQLYGFASSQHSLFKTTGSFYNPGPYAGYLAMVAPLALYYCLKYWHYMQEKMQISYWKQYGVLALSSITLTCIVVVLPATGSRASWLAALFGCSLVFILERQSFALWIKNHTKKVALCFFIGIVFLGFVCYGLYTFKRDSADGRVLIWKNTIELIKNNPTGVGLGFYAGSFGEYQAKYFENKGTKQEKMIAGNPEYAFNEYLQICAELGVIGLLLFILVIIATFASAFKNNRHGPLGSLMALLVFAGMSYPFSLVPFIISFILLISLCTYIPLPNAPNDKETSLYTPLLLFSIGAVCAMVYILVQTKQLYAAYKSWGSSSYLYHAKAYKNAEEAYTEHYESLKDNIEYLFQYGQLLSHLENYSKSNKVLQRAASLSSDPMIFNIIGKNYQAMGEYTQASAHYAQAMNRVPHRLYPYYLLAQMYIENKETEKARQMAKKLLDIDVKIASPATKQMRDEMQSFLDSLE